MKGTQPRIIETISEYHDFRHLPRPHHPLISVIDIGQCENLRLSDPIRFVHQFYTIGLKRTPDLKMKYGQQTCDFDEGVLFFMSPGQVFSVENHGEKPQSGYILLIHPEFLWNTALAKKMRGYGFFDYAVHEALHLSDKEEQQLIGVIATIEQECRSNLDAFTHGVIVAQLEVLLAYAERFYHRQFLTRRAASHALLERMEALLREHFDATAAHAGELPTVNGLAEALHLSPGYLSSMLRTLTGQSAQAHIHETLIARAKQRLSTTTLSVGEIAYELGFEHTQSFSKLFKRKVSVTPGAFRAAFN